MLRADPVRGWTDMQLFSTAAFFLAVCASLHLTAAEPSFDIREYPFSYAGSYMSVMIRQREAGSREALYIQDVSGERMWGWKGVFRIDPVADGQVLEYAAEATASKITLRTRQGDVELCYAAPDILRIRGRGAGIRITQEIGSWSGANFPLNYEKTVWMCKMWGPHYAISVLRGASRGDAATTVVNEAVTGRPQFILDVFPDAAGRWEIALEQFQDAWDGKTHDLPFDRCVENARTDFLEFSQKIPATPAAYASLRPLGAYVKWSSVVDPRTAIRRRSMYQSKNYMTAIWSWDNCFGAMATCLEHRFALDQLLVLFDHQTRLGILPDFLTEKYPMYAAYKPPVQGFTMKKMEQLSGVPFTAAELATVYGPIAKLTDFWMTYMDNNGNGVPQYNNSNDCADNCAIFNVGYPTETPDLSTHLVIQMDFLAEAAARMGRPDEAAHWSSRADTLVGKLVEHLWTGDRFVSKNVFTGEYCQDCRSFVNYTPVMLGGRLPAEVREKLLHDLRTSGIVTPYGPASEHPASPHFIEDGYWRGAVWAPQVLFLVEGLNRCGETEWARELAKNYCDMCLASGFPENFSALDGRPLRDSAYSWTVDVFFVLAHEYLR
jgi:putative isomerase